jgi:hypothetical protein
VTRTRKLKKEGNKAEQLAREKKPLPPAPSPHLQARTLAAGPPSRFPWESPEMLAIHGQAPATLPGGLCFLRGILRRLLRLLGCHTRGFIGAVIGTIGAFIPGIASEIVAFVPIAELSHGDSAVANNSLRDSRSSKASLRIREVPPGRSCFVDRGIANAVSLPACQCSGSCRA